ncbi:MAG TPA: hypothetical protein PK752_17005, partial [Accumulibacter sp.]|nr:hypothetical protein [Accumulibacter sp.]
DPTDNYLTRCDEHFSGDGGPATSAQLGCPSDVAVAPDGTLYIADAGSSRIRRVGTDGIISTVVGKGHSSDPLGIGGPATQANIPGPWTIELGPDGSLYTYPNGGPILRITPDGIVRLFADRVRAGDCAHGSGDGGPATSACIHGGNNFIVAADGSMYVADRAREGCALLRRIGSDGIINTVAGTSDCYLFSTIGPDSGPATQVPLGDLSMAMSPDGNLYLLESAQHGTNVGSPSYTRIRRVGSPFPGHGGLSDLFIAAEDGSEVYRFDANGLHLQTLNALTGAVRHDFAYDSRGRLATITDGDGNVTTIERDVLGLPTAIVAPFGQRTTLRVNANGYLEQVTNPAGESHRMAYTDSGLLTEFRDARNQPAVMAYDADGLLIADTDAAGATQKLARTRAGRDYEVTLKSGMGRTTRYAVQAQTTRNQTGQDDLPTGNRIQKVVAPDGTQTTTLLGQDGSEQTTRPDGTVETRVQSADPRFAMQAPITARVSVKTGAL